MGHSALPVRSSAKKRRNKGQFVNRPFTAWHKRTEKCKEHELTQYHQESLQQAEIFTQAVEHPTSTVSTLLDTKKAANVERNRTILKCVLEAVIYCGRQCIALRGDNEKLNESGNPGNVLSLLKLMANHNEIIRIHLEASQMKCVTFMSPQTQNELLEVVCLKLSSYELYSLNYKARYRVRISLAVTPPPHLQTSLRACHYIIESYENSMFMSLFSPYLYSYTQMCTRPLISQDIHRFCLVYTTTCTFSTYYMNVVRITLILFSHYGLVISNNVKSCKNFHATLMLYRQLYSNSFNAFLVQYLQYLFFLSEFDCVPFLMLNYHNNVTACLLHNCLTFIYIVIFPDPNVIMNMSPFQLSLTHVVMLSPLV